MLRLLVLLILIVARPSVSGRVGRSTLTPSSIYEGCGSSKGCQGDRIGCLRHKSCKILITHSLAPAQPSYFQIQLLGQIGGNRLGYVAMGLSDDMHMGMDSVVACTLDDSGNLNVTWSMNFGRLNERILEIGCADDKELRDCFATVAAHRSRTYILCSFLHNKRVKLRGYSFSPGNTTYYLIGARGSKVKPKSLEQHDDTVASLTKIGLWDKTNQEWEIDVLVRLHGTAMLVIWVIIVPNAIFFARYFKETFTTYVYCHRRLWWSVHMSLMVTAIVLMLGGITTIVTHSLLVTRRWPEREFGILHAQLGGVACVLLGIQGFVGWLQPKEQFGRKVFRYAHGIIGTVTYALSMGNVLLVHRLQEATMPAYAGLFALLWLLCNVGCHLAMSIHVYRQDKEMELQTKRALNPLPMHAVYEAEAPRRRLRLIILGVNVGGSVFVAMILIVANWAVSVNSSCDRFFCSN